MRILLSTAILGYLVGLGEAHCDNSEPIVYGFNDVQPFTTPPDFDTDCFPIPLFVSCVGYATDETISFESYDSNGDKFSSEIIVENEYSLQDLTDFQHLCEDLWILNDFIAQESATSGGFNYDPSGLCFDNNNDFFEANLNSGRAQFIIDTCHGSDPCAEDDAPVPCISVEQRLARLSDAVETAASYAEDRARRQTFDLTGSSYSLAQQLEEAEEIYEGDPNEVCNKPTNSDCSANAALCLELESCFKAQFNTGLFSGLLDDTDVTTDDIINDSFMYDQCFNVAYQDLLDKRDGVCQGTASTGCSSYDIGNGVGFCGEGGNPTEPVCPDRIKGYFESFEPGYPDPSGNPNYADAVASIEGNYLCQENGSPNYTDRTSADAVGITLIVKIALEATKIAAELFKDSLPHWPLYIFKVFPFQIIAVAEDTIATVLAQADLHDGLVDGAEMEAIYENTLRLLEGSSSIYDEVVCRCTSSEQTEPLRGQGCDSIDNDCDDFVDECDEDTFKPEIDISDASLNCASGNGQTTWFTSNAEALDCVSTFASVEDDCDTTVSIDSTTLSGTCDYATITLEASDRCNNTAEPAVVPVFVDDEAPSVYCGLGANPSQTLYVEDTGAGIMTDVDLLYEATDNCGRPMDVKVDVYANEIEDFHNQETAIFFRNGLWNNRVGLYVAAQYCVQSANGQCVKDPVLDTRVYTVTVSAVDEAGNEANVAECQVVILPNNKVASDFPTLSSTKQRFHLTTYTSTFTSYITTIN